MRRGRGQRGFTYVIVLVAIAAIGLGLVAWGETASRSAQREKEAELLWIGNQFRNAIGLYYQRTPDAVKRYPAKLEDLLEDRRFLSTQRYLRRIYADPMTGRVDWNLIVAPEGGVMGVASSSVGAPIRTAQFASGVESATTATTYTDWRFTYLPLVSQSPAQRRN